MRLDAKREREVKKRQGFALRVIVAIIWLGLCIAAGYYFFNWLLESGTLTMGFFYGRLHIPPTVREGVIVAGSIFVFIIVVNFFVLIGYALASPGARRRPGTPSLYSSDPDPDDRKFDYR